MSSLTGSDFVSLFQIIAIDLVLSGDNVVVIAIAAHQLPRHQRHRAVAWGTAIAVGLRVVLTLLAAQLCQVPGVLLVAGVALLLLAIKLLRQEEQNQRIPGSHGTTWSSAIWTMAMANLVMSLDNVLAVAGAAHGHPGSMIFGLLIAALFLVIGSEFIAMLLDRWKWLMPAGTAILAVTAANMILQCPLVASFVARNQDMVLARHWQRWMVTAEPVSDFVVDERLAAQFAGRIDYDGQKLAIVGSVTAAERDVLMDHVSRPQDRRAISALYEAAHERPVSEWVSSTFGPTVALSLQNKWPASVCERLQDRSLSTLFLFYPAAVGMCFVAGRRRRTRAGYSGKDNQDLGQDGQPATGAAEASPLGGFTE